MYMIEDLDDVELIKDIVESTYNGLNIFLLFLI